MKLEYKRKKEINSKEVEPELLLIGLTTFVTLYMYLLTEFLSAFRALNERNIKLAWGIFLCVLILLKYRFSIKFHVNRFVWKDNVIMIPVFIIGVSVGLIALFTVPYNYDSMTYHLARVMNWEQNQSVNFYATSIERQIFNSPLAEYVILNIKLLFHMENLFNMVQYYAYIASSIVIYGICKKLKITKICGQIACLIFMTAPIITIEATTTQNDLYACMWALFGVYILVSYTSTEEIQLTLSNIVKTVCLAAVLAMCYLTKGTACLAIVPFAVFMVLYRIIKKDRIRTLLVHFLVGAISAVALILPFVLKNMGLFGSLFGIGNYGNVLVEKFGIRYVFLNFIKNVAAHSAWNEFAWVNEWILKFVQGVAAILHIDVNDPAISYSSMEYGIVPSYACDSATIPCFVILFVLSIILFFALKKRIIIIQKIYFVLAFLSVFVTYSLIKWQPWITRLTIGAVAIACVSIGIILDSLFQDNRKRIVLFSVICTISCFFIINPLNYIFRISIDTMGHYGNFYGSSHRQEGYENASERIREKGYSNIGLKIGEDSYEYPIWKLLEDEDVTIKHVLIQDSSTSKLEDGTFIPDCIFVADQPQYTDDSIIECHGEYYSCIFVSGNVQVFEKMDSDNIEVIHPDDKNVFLSGFGDSEEEHIWMLDKESKIRINAKDSSEITFVMNFRIFGDSQRLKVYSDKDLLFDGVVDTDERSTIKFTIPVKQTVDGNMDLTFYHEDAVSPKKLGVANDMRELSFDIYSIEIHR